MATVYVAQHTLIGRMVAIKVLHHQFARDPGCVKRFMNEGRAAGTLGHPNIVESTDMGFAPDGAPFLVLELLEGKTLMAEIHSAGPFAVKRAACVSVQIASALATAHRHHIIHRDLKPENVFLVPDDEMEDHVKILDFGIARFMRGGSSQATQQGALLGTPDFMAPEQITAPDKVDSRIDVYALGAMLYKMLTGRAPFHDTPFPLILNSIQHDTPESLAALRPGLPVEFVALVERAMAKVADERFQTIDDMLAAMLPYSGVSMSQVVVRKRAMTPTPSAVQGAGQTGAGGSFTPRESDTAARRLQSAQRAESSQAMLSGSQQLSPSQQIITGTGAGTPVIIQQQKSRWTAVAAIVALLAASAAVGAVFVMRDANKQSGDAAAAVPGAESAVESTVRSPDDALALYLDEVSRLAAAGRFDRAHDLLQKAHAVEGASAKADVRLSQLSDQVEIGTLMVAADKALVGGDRETAIDLAKQVLDRNSGETAALALLERARQEAVAEAPAPVGEPGTLFVRSTPRATVYLDDALIGRTPIADFEVAAGPHRIELRKSGYTPARKRVKVRANKRTRVKVSLEEVVRVADAPAVAPADTAEVPTAEPVVPRPDPEPVPEPESKPPVREPKVDLPRPVEPVVRPPRSDPPAVDSIAAPRLPKTHKVDKIKDLSRVLRIIEREVVDRGGVDASVAKGVTAKLARAAFDAYAPGKTITIRPRKMYYTIVKSARAGKSRGSIASKLRSLHESGKL